MIVLITRLSLAIGSGCLDFGEPLLDSVFPAQGHERMMFRIAPVLLPVIAVELLYRVGTFFEDLFQKDLRGILGLVRKDRRVTVPGRSHRWPQRDTLFSRKRILP